MTLTLKSFVGRNPIKILTPMEDYRVEMGFVLEDSLIIDNN